MRTGKRKRFLGISGNQSNHYIHQEEIKTMKRLKADILSIRPVLSQENPGAHSGQMEDFPFEVSVRNYYRKKFQTEMDEETFSLLMEILMTKETAYETTDPDFTGN